MERTGNQAADAEAADRADEWIAHQWTRAGRAPDGLVAGESQGSPDHGADGYMDDIHVEKPFLRSRFPVIRRRRGAVRDVLEWTADAFMV